MRRSPEDVGTRFRGRTAKGIRPKNAQIVSKKTSPVGRCANKAIAVSKGIGYALFAQFAIVPRRQALKDVVPRRPGRLAEQRRSWSMHRGPTRPLRPVGQPRMPLCPEGRGSMTVQEQENVRAPNRSRCPEPSPEGRWAQKTVAGCKTAR